MTTTNSESISIKAKKITADNFRPYGRVIFYPGKAKKSKKVNLFRIVVKEPVYRGWRIAYLILRDKMIKRLEQHPHSFESFEPVTGQTLLYVARKPRKNHIKCFYLDRPIILKKGIWHGVVTLSKESEIKLTENASVRCVYAPLGCLLGPSKR
ncbi:MAG: ureidoglycolate lyase [Candidatus Omnitrophota bacterium]